MDSNDIDIASADKDSGMSSLGGSKDDSPERKEIQRADAGFTDNDNCDDEPDETMGERLWGLTEMFPTPVRRFCSGMSEISSNSIKAIYTFTCNASWIFFTSSMILFAPVIFETERAQMEEMQKTQTKQVLLGPGSALNAGGSPALPQLR